MKQGKFSSRWTSLSMNRGWENRSGHASSPLATWWGRAVKQSKFARSTLLRPLPRMMLHRILACESSPCLYFKLRKHSEYSSYIWLTNLSVWRSIVRWTPCVIRLEMTFSVMESGHEAQEGTHSATWETSLMKMNSDWTARLSTWRVLSKLTVCLNSPDGLRVL